MARIKRFSDGTLLEVDKGKFDNNCVYITRPGKERYAPRDEDYFSFFIEKSAQYTPEKIYSDFVKIYNRTTARIDGRLLDDIDRISTGYRENDVLEFNIWFSVIYLAMIAEERKAYAVLKKRIKRLGMYQILFEEMSAWDAARFSRGRTVRQLDPMCRERGF